MRIFSLLSFCLSLGVSLCLPAVSGAHEFWLSPQGFEVDPNEIMRVDIRVGQDFKGPAYGYIPDNFQRFEMVQGDDRRLVEGRIGDRPALQVKAPGAGLWVVVHETSDQFVSYTEAGKFRNFVTHKDLRGTLEAHDARGLPETGFKERYRRFAKSLIAVGDGAGADRAVGLRTEVVALANPYVDDVSGGFDVQVFFEGAPRADVQVELFERLGETVSVTQHRTDGAGRVTLPVRPGGEYLVDAVKMLPLEGAADGAVWESLWASLTFAVPR